jgi:hypothetical protein
MQKTNPNEANSEYLRELGTPNSERLRESWIGDCDYRWRSPSTRPSPQGEGERFVRHLVGQSRPVPILFGVLGRTCDGCVTVCDGICDPPPLRFGETSGFYPS